MKYAVGPIKVFFRLFSFVMLLGFLIPQNLKMPVEGATKDDFNKNSFWFYPWGNSITHKGVDIFAKEGTSLKSSTKGLVLFAGRQSKGGNFVLILGPKWRVHYYAHLNEIRTKKGQWVNSNSLIGKVGSTGNTKGKPPHLHYSIASIIPYPWRIDKAKQGWKKMFYLNPIDYL